MASLDIAVSGAIMRLHALERALHDDGPWEMEFAGVRVPANRFVLNDRVQFCALFPRPLPTNDDWYVWLLCDGQPVATEPMRHFQMGEDVIVDWVMELDSGLVSA